MIVREDDTVVCEVCYLEELLEPHEIPPHRWAFAFVKSGTCEMCGKVEDEPTT